MKITVYTIPACIQCEFTKKVLDKSGVPYSVVDLTDNPRSREELADLGHKTAPVVVVTDPDSGAIARWAGFQPDRLNAAVKQAAPTT